MESPNSLYNNINNTSKDGLENTENIVIPSNFLISTKEIIARFPHNKRVGHYLLGRKLGEGSFAKVKEGLHTLTGQKVNYFIFFENKIYLFKMQINNNNINNLRLGRHQSDRQKESQRRCIREQKYAPRRQATSNDHSSKYNSIV